MIEEREIVIDQAGRILYLSSPGIDDALAGLGRLTKKRASHVEPVRLSLRILFRILRVAFGETGRVSDFTRSWPCLWRADLRISGGPVSGPYLLRSDAIRAEEEWLLANRF